MSKRDMKMFIAFNNSLSILRSKNILDFILNLSLGALDISKVEYAERG